MPEIAPFAAIRFDHTRTGGDLSAFISPPYDVLNQDDKDALLAKSDRNIVALDLPHIPPKSAGPDEVYQRSAESLRQWLSDGTLVRDERPALYLYHQKFEHDGQTYTRRMFIARARLQPFSEGSIVPHEQTFGGPKEDRLALMKATECQLSPLLGMYSDPDDRVGTAFAGRAASEPDAAGVLEGVENRVWIVTDTDTIETVVAAMADKKIYIADGHHRYGTALMYRDWVASNNPGPLPDHHPARFVMFALASMDDSGCLILPYNRVLAHIELAAVLGAFAAGTERTSPDRADLVLYDGRTKDEVPMRFSNRDVLKTLEPDRCSAWHKLDYAYLHRYLIEELLVKTLGEDKVQVRYVKSLAQARQTAQEQDGVALLVNATPMAHLQAVSEAGALMPPKSTYFHPKLATGVTLSPLA